MITATLLTLLDDITAMLDDVATMTKVASSKTAALIGDDMALNAQQVTGASPARELPIIYAVAKGSLINKAILVPVAVLLSLFLPVLITPLLVLGGLFLCFEGVEKILHKPHNPKTDPIDEATKIRGAIRTDFILSAEIIVIALGSVADAALQTQIGVLIAVSLGVTLIVYGGVAAIVKIDDLGIHLIQKEQHLWKCIGCFLLQSAPKIMRTLNFVGTAAMFLVGGGILIHALPTIEHGLMNLIQDWPYLIRLISKLGYTFIFGIAAGWMTHVIYKEVKKIAARYCVDR